MMGTKVRCTYILLLLLNCLLSVLGQAQTRTFPDLPDDLKLIFIGEYHRIYQNQKVQMEWLRHLVEHEGVNTLILEKAPSVQFLRRDLVNNGDSSLLDVLIPQGVCLNENCNHDYQPVKSFFVDLMLYAESVGLSVHFVDVEWHLEDTQGILLKSFERYKNNPRFSVIYQSLAQATGYFEIESALMEWVAKHKKLKKFVSKEDYLLLKQTLDFYEVQKSQDIIFGNREEFLYQRFNSLFEDASVKAMAIYGLFHTIKVPRDHERVMFQLPSVACKLNDKKDSKINGKVFSVAPVYFNERYQPGYHDFANFTAAEVEKVYKISEENSGGIIDLRAYQISPEINTAYDLIMPVTNAEPMMGHSRIYRSKGESE